MSASIYATLISIMKQDAAIDAVDGAILKEYGSSDTRKIRSGFRIEHHSQAAEWRRYNIGRVWSVCIQCQASNYYIEDYLKRDQVCLTVNPKP